MANVLTANETTDEMIQGFTAAQQRAEGAAGLPLLFPRTDGGIPFEIEIPAVAWTPTTLETLFSLVRTDLYNASPTANTLRYYDWIADATAKFLAAWAEDGDSAMRLSKRVARIAKTVFDHKLSESRLNQIGSLEGALKGRSMTVDVTSALVWNAGDFGDKGSCFFTSNTHHRTQIHPKMGTAALRTFDSNGKGNGRALLVPLGNGQPAFVYTNFYGAMSADNYDGVPNIGLRTAKAILEADSGFEWAYEACSPRLDDTYVNGGANVLFPAARPWRNMPVRIRESLPLPSWAQVIEEGKRKPCAYCGETHNVQGMTPVYAGGLVCDECLGDHYIYCEDVSMYTHEDDAMYAPNGNYVTSTYYYNHCVVCDQCGEGQWLPDMGHGGYNVAVAIYDGNMTKHYACANCAQKYCTYSVIDRRTYLVAHKPYSYGNRRPLTTLYTCHATGYTTAFNNLEEVVDANGNKYMVSHAVAYAYASTGEDGIKRFVKVDEDWQIKPEAWAKEDLIALARMWRSLHQVGITIQAAGQ